MKSACRASGLVGCGCFLGFVSGLVVCVCVFVFFFFLVLVLVKRVSFGSKS